MSSVGHTSISKLAAALPAYPVLKKTLVPGAAQSSPFLLVLVGQPINGAVSYIATEKHGKEFGGSSVNRQTLIKKTHILSTRYSSLCDHAWRFKLCLRVST